MALTLAEMLCTVEGESRRVTPWSAATEGSVGIGMGHRASVLVQKQPCFYPQRCFALTSFGEAQAQKSTHLGENY